MFYVVRNYSGVNNQRRGGKLSYAQAEVTFGSTVQNVLKVYCWIIHSFAVHR